MVDGPYRFEIASRAEVDAASIFNWLADRSLRGAKNWFLAYEAALLRIGQNPLHYGLAIEASLLSQELRECFFHTRFGKKYRIVFLIRGDWVIILRVRRPGQDLLGEEEVRPS